MNTDNNIRIKLQKIPENFPWPLWPTLIFLFVICIYPLIFLIRLAFMRWNLISISGRYFVGLDNFIRIFNDHDFWNSLWVTLIFVLFSVGIQLFLGMFLALILNQDLKGENIFRGLLLLPMLLTPVVTGLMWRFMLHPDYGIWNYLISLLGIKKIEWLSSTLLALPAIIIVDVWQWTPFTFLILLAGLQSLPREPYEQAQIDGASSWQTFWFMTVPLIKRYILVALLLRLIDALRQYDLIYMMTRGGPINTTETLSWHIYQVGFKFFEFGHASALAWIFLIIAIFISKNFIKMLQTESYIN